MCKILNLETLLLKGEEKNECGSVLLYPRFRNLRIGTMQPHDLIHALYCSVLLIFSATAPSGPGPSHSRGF